MIEELLTDNETIIDLLNQCFASAEEENQQGIADFIASRIDAHAKHGWMLRSFTKVDRA
jgi:starvation-inducible DNA-binding protein